MKRTPEEETQFKARKEEMTKFFDSIKDFQIQPAIDIFRNWKSKNETLNVNIYNSLFSMFRKAEHLPIATGTISLMQ